MSAVFDVCLAVKFRTIRLIACRLGGDNTPRLGPDAFDVAEQSALSIGIIHSHAAICVVAVILASSKVWCSNASHECGIRCGSVAAPQAADEAVINHRPIPGVTATN